MLKIGDKVKVVIVGEVTELSKNNDRIRVYVEKKSNPGALSDWARVYSESCEIINENMPV